MRINNFDKKISLLALTLFLLFISGCATTQVIDKIPPGIPKGFVEFRLQCYRASNSGYYNGFLIPTYFVVINEIAPDGSDLGIAAEKWGGSTLYLAARPGEHTYRFWFRNKVIHQS